MKKPTKILLNDVCMSLKFSPNDETLGAADITGTVSFHKNAMKTVSIQVHEGSCRSIDYNVEGTGIFTVGIDRTLQMIHLDREKVVLKKTKAHSDSINIVKCLDENLIATGDDRGCIKIWDMRSRKIARKWHENSDFISDMLYDPHKHTLIATGGDGCLTVLDSRKEKPVAVSDNQDDDLLSVAMIKNGSKIVVGTQSGNLLIFSWGEWYSNSDKFPGHPMSVSSLVKGSNDNILYTGSSDGLVRVVSVLPNSLKGTIGDFKQDIECLSLSFDEKWLASSGHDETIKIWDASLTAMDSTIFDQDEESKAIRDSSASGTDDSSNYESEEEIAQPAKKLKQSFKASNSDFFADLD